MKKITLLLALLTLLLQANAQLSPLSFYDNFAEDSKIVWPHMATGNEMYYKESGRYIVEYKQGERGWSVNSNFPKVQWDGLSIEVTVNVLEGNSPGIGTGLLIGNSSTPGISYRFVIQTNGTYGFGYLKDNALKWIVPFSASKNIVKGNNVDNKLKIKITSNKVQLYINYVLENTAILPEPITGEQIALYSGKGQRAAFDNLRIDGFSLISDPPGKIVKENNTSTNNSTAEIIKYNTAKDFIDFLNGEFKNNFPHFNKRIAQNKLWYYQPIFIKDQNSLGVKNAYIRIDTRHEDIGKCVPKGEIYNISIRFLFKSSPEASNFVAMLTNSINTNNATERLVSVPEVIKPEYSDFGYCYGNKETGLIQNALKIEYFENKASTDYMGDGWGEFKYGVHLQLYKRPNIICTYTDVNPKDYNTDFAKDFRRLVSGGGVYEGTLKIYKNEKDSTQSEKDFNSFFEKVKLTLGNEYYSSEDRRDCTRNSFSNENTLYNIINNKSNYRYGPKERTIYFKSRTDPDKRSIKLIYFEKIGDNNKFERYLFYAS